MTMKGLFKTIMMCAACAFVIGSCSTGAKTSENAAGEVEKKQAVDTLGENDGRYVKIDSLEGLVAYYPQFSRIDLAMGVMPTKEDTAVVFCAAGAFTGTYLDEFKHTNIAGDHVSGGVRYEGYQCAVNTGCFAYYGGSEWEFAYGEHDRLLDKAAEKGGMAYSQVMMICNGEVKQDYRVNPKNTHDKNEFVCDRFRRICTFQRFCGKSGKSWSEQCYLYGYGRRLELFVVAPLMWYCSRNPRNRIGLYYQLGYIL